ncbi:hypothetical protein [Leifsonia sp. 22587]|uniref:hypothetical protein n=1 Tax=Leifsonia sp. 22587 TaxID=3453946 RepID=UPI003F84CE96
MTSYSIELSDDFYEANNLDPNVRLDTITEDHIEFINKLRARANFTMDRGTYADPVFAQVLANQGRKLRLPGYRGPIYRRYASMPVEDLVFSISCADGAMTLSRKAVLLVFTAQKLGHIDVAACTTTDVSAVVGRDD